MLKKIRLFLRGMEADLPQAPDILFNYTEDDLRNPTIVKNSYTKTITLDDTLNNNKIFMEFWDNQFVVSQGFNPTKKMPFLLYQNGDLIEEGYARLDSVVGGVNSRKYQITLFGGLGDFFYNLMYNDSEGGKRRLCDLYYGAGYTSASEFDFTICAETLNDAWYYLEHNSSFTDAKKWKYINFMPAYEGYPDDFDSDKVLIHFEDSNLISGVTSGSSAYTAFDTYALANMKGQHTGDEMREFRSYLQRPIIKVNKVIEACCNPDNNGGYTVDLDSTFFNDNNPYWNDTWMTLPLLTSFEEIIDSTLTGVTVGVSSADSRGGDDKPSVFYYQSNPLSISGSQWVKNNAYAFTLNLGLGFTLAGSETYDESTFNLNYYYDSSYYYESIIVMQLVAYSADGHPITGGKAVVLTNTFNGSNAKLSDWSGAKLPWGNEYVENVGAFSNPSGRALQWNNNIQVSIDKVPKEAKVKLVVRKYSRLSETVRDAYGPGGYGYPLNCLVWNKLNGSNHGYFWDGGSNAMSISLDAYSVELMNSGIVRTGSKFTKAKLLDTDYSPADFLLSFCKMYGLYFTKDRYEKKIYIRTRDSYYLPDNIETIGDKIDRGNMEIKPVFMGTKWLDFDTETEESAALTKYKDSFGINYGLQRINTGYDFNSDSTSLFEGSIFRGGITALEKSEGFSTFDDDTYKPWMLEGYDYQLYLSGSSDSTTGVTYKEESTIGVLQPMRSDVPKYYDLFEKLQFHDSENSPIAGDRVLVFFNGVLSTDRNKVKYWITDDNYDMMLLNDGKPCWLWTTTDWYHGTERIAISVSYTGYCNLPLFSRYKYAQDGTTITKSLDFGTPKQLFNPLNTITSGSSLYSQYWEKFVNDLYSADTRVVTTKMPLPDNFSEEDMRKFYYFDGNIWRLNAVSEHNISNYEPTKVEFVKVQDKYNYQ